MNLWCLALGHQWRWLVRDQNYDPRLPFTTPATYGGLDRCDRCRETRPHWRAPDLDDESVYGSNRRGLSIEEYDDILGQFAEYRRHE